MMIPLRLSTCILLLLGVISIGLLAGCEKHDEASAATVEHPATPVTAAEAVARDVPLYLDEIGRCVSPEMVTVTPQVDGRITEIGFVEGAEVNKGDVLFSIDPRPFKADLAKAEADLARGQAEHERARVEFDRINKLQGTNAISQDEYDTKRLAVDVMKAQVEAWKAAVETEKLNLEYCTIRSPLSGRSGRYMINVGNVVKKNDAVLAVIQQLNPIYAEFTITENDLGTVRKFIATRGLDLKNPEQGLKVFADVPGDSKAVLSALGTPKPATEPSKNRAGPREGSLTFLDNAVEGGTGTVRLRATLQNEDHYFWPGQFVNCRLILTTKKDAVLIPAEAQQISQQGSFVYVVGADETAELRPIVLGQRQGDLIVVESGVAAGERVITTGQMMVVPKGKVKVTNAAKAPATQAS